MRRLDVTDPEFPGFRAPTACGAESDCGQRHPHGRRTHDRQDGLLRSRSWLEKGELNRENKSSFPGTAPPDERLLAGRQRIPSFTISVAGFWNGCCSLVEMNASSR
jgi:hypothetical protein